MCMPRLMLGAAIPNWRDVSMHDHAPRAGRAGAHVVGLDHSQCSSKTMTFPGARGPFLLKATALTALRRASGGLPRLKFKPKLGPAASADARACDRRR